MKKFEYWISEAEKAISYHDIEEVFYAVNKAVDVRKFLTTIEEWDKFYSTLKALRTFAYKKNLFDSTWAIDRIIAKLCLVIK